MSDYEFESGRTTSDDEDVLEDAPKSALDKLRAKVEKDTRRPEVLIEVPERPGVYLLVSPNITEDQMSRYRKMAERHSKKGDFSNFIFATVIISQTTVGIQVDGEEVLTDNGDPMTFASPEIKDMVEADRPWPDAVRAFFGTDPHVEAAAVAIINRSGWGEEVSELDPTE